MAVGPRLIVIQHEQPYGRGQITVLALRIDRRDEFGQSYTPVDGDLLEPSPECVLEAHAGLVPGDDDGAFDDRRFHCPSPISIRCWSRLFWAFLPRDCSRARSAFERPCTIRLDAASCSAWRRLARLRAVRRL